MIYWIRSGDTPHIKVGHTNSVLKRLALLQTGCPYKLTLLRCENGGPSLEAALHRHYAGKRLRAEWFVLSDHDVAVDLKSLPPAPPRPPKVIVPKMFVTRALTAKDHAVVLPEPLAWKVFGFRQDDQDLQWSRALHGWLIANDHTPQRLAPRLGVIPHTVAGWVGWGNRPQRVPAERLIVESDGVLAPYLTGTRHHAKHPVAA